MKRIYLKGKHGDGKYVLVDDDIYYELMERDIAACLNSKGYVVIKIKGKTVPLHKFVVGEENIPKGKQVDHMNDSTLDNTLSNLRVCTAAQNIHNRRPLPSKFSAFKGVRSSKGTRCRANIRATVDGKTTKISKSFSNEIDAATCYNRMAIKLHGKYGRINTIPVPGTISVEECERKYGKYIGDDNNEK